MRKQVARKWKEMMIGKEITNKQGKISQLLNRDWRGKKRRRNEWRKEDIVEMKKRWNLSSGEEPKRKENRKRKMFKEYERKIDENSKNIFKYQKRKKN